jgi:hypothetical protein
MTAKDFDERRNRVEVVLGGVRLEGGLRSWDQLPPLNQLRDAAMERVTFLATAPVASLPEAERDSALATARTRVSSQRRSLTKAFLAQVAEAHRSAPDRGRHAAIQERWQVPKDTAMKWIGNARKEGLSHRRPPGAWRSSGWRSRASGARSMTFGPVHECPADRSHVR